MNTLLVLILVAAPCAAEFPVDWRPTPADPAASCRVDGRVPHGLAHEAAPRPPRPATKGDVIDDQYITHWVRHYDTLAGTINDDLVGETSFEGLCGNGPLAGIPEAPRLIPYYTHYKTMQTSAYDAYDFTNCVFTPYNRTRYFYTWVKSNGLQEVEAVIGASDYFKLWINGGLAAVRSSGGPKPYTRDEYRFLTVLRDGWNLLLVKQSFPQLGPPDDPDPNNTVKFFSLRFVDRAGMPVQLVAAFDPMCGYRGDDGAGTKVVVPSIAHLPGAGGSQWQADVMLHNGTHMTWFLELLYFREGNSSGTPDAVAEGEIAAFGTVSFEDALRHSGLFNVATDQKGYFEVRHGFDVFFEHNGWLKTKVYNLAAEGSFGMDVPVHQFWDGTGTEGTFFGMRHGDFRSNFGMVPWNNEGASARIRLTLYGSDLLGTVTREYGPINGMWQLNNVFADLGVPDVNTATATLFMEILDNPTGTMWYPYVSINDGNPHGTSDPILFDWGWFGATPPELR
jgi:hypothetical protein